MLLSNKFNVDTNRFKLNHTKETAYNTDTVLLSNFIKVPKGCKNALDIGTGSGVLMLDLAMKTSSNIYGIEVQENRALLAIDNVKINNLDSRLFVIKEDLNNYKTDIQFDLIVTNPPFFKVINNTRLSENEEEMIARHEVKLSLEELLSNASRLLKYRGHFFMVHRPDRLDEIIECSIKYNLAIKEIRLVYPYLNSNANHVLIHAIKNGGKGLNISKPLIIYEDKHKFTKEMEKIIGEF